MTKQECAIVMAFTGMVMLNGDDFDIFHKYVEKIMGRPVWIHELPMLEEKIKEKAEPDFIRLCEEAIEENAK